MRRRFLTGWECDHWRKARRWYDRVRRPQVIVLAGAWLALVRTIAGWAEKVA